MYRFSLNVNQYLINCFNNLSIMLNIVQIISSRCLLGKGKFFAGTTILHRSGGQSICLGFENHNFDGCLLKLWGLKSYT